MIDPLAFLEALQLRGFGFFAGVPDSLLKSFCACLSDRVPAPQHVIAANEGNAIALAVGHHLATNSAGVVYMQNSGLGNAVNPLASLADAEVYRIPMLLIIGWRGEPGIDDEPQHMKQGRITPGLLDLLDIPYRILQGDSNQDSLLDELTSIMHQTGKPTALLVRKKVFLDHASRTKPPSISNLLREEALDVLLSLISPHDLLVATTGKTSRELFELRLRRGEEPSDFLTVGSMGHASSIALGIALARPGSRVICLDGDGSMLMHLGALAISGNIAPANLVYVLLNNAAHESVGGQPTVADRVDMKHLAIACGFNYVGPVSNSVEIAPKWEELFLEKAPYFFELRLRCGSRPELGRPTSTPAENKHAFMKKLK